MIKTPEQLADEWLFGRYGSDDFNEHNYHNTAEEIFIAGYKTAMRVVELQEKIVDVVEDRMNETLDYWARMRELCSEDDDENT